jgi:alcohol dehydrogenase class IV
VTSAAPFELATAARIVFGDGTLSRLPELACNLGGARALLVTGSRPERHAGTRAALEAAGLACTVVTVVGEPTTELAREHVSTARAAGIEIVIAIGGGSVLDAGKAIAALAVSAGDPLDHLEVVGRGLPLPRPALPVIAIPTTAGTGSEVTKNAVLAEPAQRVKASLRSEHMLPRVALVDPELTWSVPPEVTASTGMDAITQVIEPFVSNAASPITDALCRDAIARGARALPRAFRDGQDREARRDMALVGLFGGIALANARLGAVHGLAGPIGGALDAPHGAVCARLLPFVIEANVDALRARAPGSPVLTRYDEVARLLTGEPDARAEDAARWAHDIAAELGIPGLGAHGLAGAELEAIAERSERASSMKGNPIALERRELVDVLERAL